jgi:lysyl oxidase
VRETRLLIGWVAVALAAIAATAAVAAQDVLPDIRQVPPADLKLEQFPVGSWHLGFTSKVFNDGAGILEVHGSRTPDSATMDVEQIVHRDDGSTVSAPHVGVMKYTAGDHNHWHLLDFERYLLYPVDSSAPPVRDQKTGFCLATAIANGFCGQGQPDLLDLTMGLAPGASDTYGAYLDGQAVPIDPVNTPTGNYVLVHRANPECKLRESTIDNNAAAIGVRLTWTAGTPSVEALGPAPVPAASLGCPPPPSPPSPPPPPADTQPAPAANSTPTPSTTPPSTTPTTNASYKATAPLMTRATAARLVRTALVQALEQRPVRPRVSCHRTSRSGFSCRVSWFTKRGTSWRGRVTVLYVLRADGSRAVRYKLTAVERPGGRRVHKVGTQGRAVAGAHVPR